jgi:hypothetical protein
LREGLGLEAALAQEFLQLRSEFAAWPEQSEQLGSKMGAAASLSKDEAQTLAHEKWDEDFWEEISSNGRASRAKLLSMDTRVRLLPDWMLDFKCGLAQFSGEVAKTTEGLGQLKALRSRLHVHTCSTVDANHKRDDHIQTGSDAFAMHLYEDTLANVFAFLDNTQDCVNFSLSCTALHCTSLHEMAWERHATLRWAISTRTGSTHGWRELCVMHGQALKGALSVMEQIQMERMAHRKQDPSGVALSDGEHVISHCHTMASDQRCITMKGLKQFLMVTSNSKDNISMRLFLGAEAVPILVALLCNESQAMQELACAALGNLFCTSSAEHDDRERAQKARESCEGCLGLKYVARILRSPLTSVNGCSPSTIYMGLAIQEAARAMCNLLLPGLGINGGQTLKRLCPRSDFKEDGSIDKQRQQQEETEGNERKEKKEEATLKADKLWVSLSQPIHQLGMDRSMGSVSSIGPVAVAGTDTTAQATTVGSDGRVLWQLASYYQSGGIKHIGIVEFRFLADGTIEGAGRDSLGAFEIHGTIEDQRDVFSRSMACHFYKSYDFGAGRTVPVHEAPNHR